VLSLSGEPSWEKAMQPDTNARHEEAELIARLQHGDDDAFEAMVQENTARLTALARRILGDEDAALDAVQDAFLNAHRAIDRFNGESRLSTWLHRITVNSALGIVRQRKRRREIQLGDELDDVSEMRCFDELSLRAHQHGVEDAEDVVELRQQREIVGRCLSGLKENHRRVLTLRYLRDLDTAKTAQVLGVAPNTVKTRLLRARDALRANIDRDERTRAALGQRAA
jgi:RNA polymerase sigma-70 factor (ECF subfamily)